MDVIVIDNLCVCVCVVCGVCDLHLWYMYGACVKTAFVEPSKSKSQKDKMKAPGSYNPIVLCVRVV